MPRSAFAPSALFVALLLSVATPAPAAEVTFVRVWPQWRDAGSFDRIAEYFGAPENHGAHVVLRTHADTRAGYYFLVRAKNPAAPVAARFVLQVITPASPEPLTHTFPAALPVGETVYSLGLTAADWSGGKKTHPVAWRLTLLAPDGRILAEQKSFLWEKPAASVDSAASAR